MDRLRVIFVISFLIVSSGMAAAQQENGSQDSAASPPMSIMSIPTSDNGSPQTKVEYYLNSLDLISFEVAAGDLSSCSKDNKPCSSYSRMIKFWSCAASVCGKTKKTIADCLPPEYSDPKVHEKDVQEKVSSSFCAMLEDSTNVTRQAFLRQLLEAQSTLKTDEAAVVRIEAYVMALKGSDSACENHIKAFLGPYGPNWDYQSYIAMSGCRILSHQRTRAQEEKDFATWFAVLQGTGKCSDITNPEMKKACLTPKTGSPVPPSQYGI